MRGADVPTALWNDSPANTPARDASAVPGRSSPTHPTCPEGWIHCRCAPDSGAPRDHLRGQPILPVPVAPLLAAPAHGPALLRRINAVKARSRYLGSGPLRVPSVSARRR